MKNKRINNVRIREFRRLKCVIIACLVATSCWAVDFSAKLAYSQKTQITLNLTNKTLKEVFKEIERNSEFVIFYYEGVVDANKRIKIKVKSQTVDKILDKIFEGTDNAYNIVDKQIYITKKSGNEKVAVTLPVVQQQRKITGKVIDEMGEPLPGVAIQVKGTPRGVTTDIDGSFGIDVRDDDILVFSYLGMQDQEVPVANKKQLFVTLKEKTDELEEVTIVAFAKQKKESVISSISTVKASELKVPSSNLTTTFAGKIAGVIAYQRSGEPGQDNAEFFVRGVTTFGTGKADPLILIDNVELSSSDLARLNPDDIASFSILKDAAATALYGARGANGVILVTTKEGQEGKAKLSFRFENSISAPVRDTKVASPLSFMKLHNEAVRTRDPQAALPYFDSDIVAREKGLNPYVYPMVDWKDMLFKDYTMNQRGNLNLSGGGKVARYYVALSYARDNGILDVNSANNFNNNIQLNKYTVRSNVNINVTPTTKLDVRISGTFDDYQGPLDGGTGMYTRSIKANPVLFPATFAPDEVNQYANHILFGNYGTNGEYLNPYAEMLRGYKESNSTVVNAQLQLHQDLKMVTEGLKFRALGNVSRNAYFDITRSYLPFYYSIGSYDKKEDIYTLTALNPESGTDYLGYSQGAKTVSSALYVEAALSYDRIFAEKHNTSGMLVYTAREELNGNENTLQKSLPLRNLGLAGRFSYSYDSRYFGEFNFGYNGSERFDKSHRWGFFPSGGLGWVVSNEAFWQSLNVEKIIQMLKLKASYGMVGNDAISDERFFYISEVNMNNSGKGYTFGTDFNKTFNGISISRYADNKIGWEVSYKLNTGVEMKLFDCLDIQADYFRERRTNILQNREDIPTLVGLQAIPKANIGEAKASGVDLSVDYQKFFGKDYWLTVRGNFTYASSKYSKYEEPDYYLTPWRSKVGNKLSQTYGLIAERLFIDEQDILNSPKQQFGEYMPGDIKYKDINKDGLVDEQDFVPIGYPTTPEIIYGFGFSAGLKSFDISCFFQGSARSSFWINPKEVYPFVNSLEGAKGNNAVLEFIENDHWSESNTNIYAAWPRLSAYEVKNNTQVSTWFMRDGSFLRLKSAEIGYTLPKNLSNKAKLANLRVYLSGTNLFSLSKFKYWDTEMGGNGLGYPVQRVFNVGLQVSF